MKNLEELRKILQNHKDNLKDEYAVNEIGIFGSYTKEEQIETSDIDYILKSSLGMIITVVPATVSSLTSTCRSLDVAKCPELLDVLWARLEPLSLERLCLEVTLYQVNEPIANHRVLFGNVLLLTRIREAMEKLDAVLPQYQLPMLGLNAEDSGALGDHRQHRLQVELAIRHATLLEVGRDALSLDPFWYLDIKEIKDSGVDVDQAHRSFHHAGAFKPWSADNQWDSHRGVVQGFAMVEVIVVLTKALAMIGGHEDEGIVTKAAVIHGFEELPDGLVGVGDLSLILCQRIADVSDPIELLIIHHRDAIHRCVFRAAGVPFVVVGVVRRRRIVWPVRVEVVYPEEEGCRHAFKPVDSSTRDVRGAALGLGGGYIRADVVVVDLEALVERVVPAQHRGSDKSRSPVAAGA